MHIFKVYYYSVRMEFISLETYSHIPYICKSINLKHKNWIEKTTVKAINNGTPENKETHIIKSKHYLLYIIHTTCTRTHSYYSLKWYLSYKMT